MQTHYESYKFFVMLFKLYNVLTTFISIMNGAFHNEINEYLIIYINDILIYSNNKVDHVKNLRRILSKLQ